MGVEQVLAVAHGVLQQWKVALPKQPYESCARLSSRASQHRVTRGVARPSPRAEERHGTLFGGPDRPPHELVQQRGGGLEVVVHVDNGCRATSSWGHRLKPGLIMAGGAARGA
eukprot:scaffold66669_cov78-Phaeocystis_antarctica.AAC.4